MRIRGQSVTRMAWSESVSSVLVEFSVHLVSDLPEGGRKLTKKKAGVKRRPLPRVMR